MTTLQNLGLAYRKAKVDLYYSSHASLEAIANYEENLHANLSALLAKLQGDDESWVTQDEFIGDWTLVPKSVNMTCWTEYRKQNGNGLIFSSPAEEWTHACSRLDKGDKPQKPKAEFRVMAQCSMHFHVLSTLWMLEVGHLFDAQLTGFRPQRASPRVDQFRCADELDSGCARPEKIAANQKAFADFYEGRVSRTTIQA